MSSYRFGRTRARGKIGTYKQLLATILVCKDEVPIAIVEVDQILETSKECQSEKIGMIDDTMHVAHLKRSDSLARVSSKSPKVKFDIDFEVVIKHDRLIRRGGEFECTWQIRRVLNVSAEACHSQDGSFHRGIY